MNKYKQYINYNNKIINNKIINNKMINNKMINKMNSLRISIK
jgi:hypothetical protein